MKTSSELRQLFLHYFANQHHEVVPSSSLVPVNDPTLLFTNAGMVQFKDVFLGLEHRPYERATSAQRCVRAGGKHNDLENVGYTARHHTFFEMLGNFSFGNYFKKEAIHFAWNFLIKELKLSPEKLWITIYAEDEEAADIWLKDIGVSPERFSRCGESSNFWSMGETGPCGPCTEIFYDHGPSIPGGPPGSPDEDGDRYVEIWNIVFMQYDRVSDGCLTPLPKPSVDTGMGLERLCAVMQGVHNNYDTDLFVPLIKVIAKKANEKDLTHTSLRVIADHIRSCAFLITDGVIPSNEGRGYVLRRIIRRALRHGHVLGLREPFFHSLVKPLSEIMGEAYPELKRAQEHVAHILLQEEEQFAKTLEQGLRILEQALKELEDKEKIPGPVVFKLYDTYGFPPDLTADMARERGLTLDMEGFHQCMEQQRAQSQEHQQFTVDYHDRVSVSGETIFEGYHTLTQEGEVLALLNEEGQPVESLNASEKGTVFLDKTPFYAESGGQVGDEGILETSHHEFVVTQTKKQKKLIGHHGFLKKGSLKIGDKVFAKVNMDLRQATALNHTATHLLHAALRQELGTHVTQKGSLVEPLRLRFDFTHGAPLTKEELRRVENLVNQKIRENIPVETHIMPVEEALKKGAMALFGEKYEEEVRVLGIEDFSVELCGGTHAHGTGDIGFFKILSESGISAGVRRIEALTGQGALEWAQAMEESLNSMAEQLKVKPEALVQRVNELLLKNKNLEKEITQLSAKQAFAQGEALLSRAIPIEGVSLICEEVKGDMETLRHISDELRNRLEKGVIVLATVEGSKVNLMAAVTKNLTSQIHAGHLVNEVAHHVGGKGGGRPDMAQAGGTVPEKLSEALEKGSEWVRKRLQTS